MRVHRQAGVVAAAVVIGHVVLVMLADPARLALLDPVDAPMRAKAGVASLTAFCALLATSLWRRRLRLPYDAWRHVHLALAGLALGAGLVHVVGVGRYLHDPAVRLHTVTVAAVGALAAGYLRLVRPRTTARRPYRVCEGAASAAGRRPSRSSPSVTAAGRSATVNSPGCAWPGSPTCGRATPSRSRRAPPGPECCSSRSRRSGTSPAGSPSSSPGRSSPSWAHGSYRPALPHAGFVPVVAGIGITPAMSLLRTPADGHDRRRVVLVYGSRRWDGVTFREELALLASRLDLRVVHVLSRPHDGWRGESGRIDAPLLDRVWPEGGPYNVVVCGPADMVATTYDAVRRRGVPRRPIHAEGSAG